MANKKKLQKAATKFRKEKSRETFFVFNANFWNGSIY